MNDVITIKNTICRSVIDRGNGIIDINLTLKNGESWTLLDSIQVYETFEIRGRGGTSKRIKISQTVQI